MLAALWVWSELRSRHPLVDMRMMRLRPSGRRTSSALLLGFGMYSAFVLIPQFVQVPESTGYGYGATVTQAGLFLVPSTLAMLLFAPARRPAVEHGRRQGAAGARLRRRDARVRRARAGPRRAGRSTSPRRCSASASASRSPSLANLIVEAVPRDQTGVATGMNTIVRTIGGAIGAQVAVSILSGHTLADGFPSEDGYTITFAICFIVMVVAVIASLLVPGRRREHAPCPRPCAEPLPAVE